MLQTQSSSPIPIKSLNPYRSKSWTIRARVTHKSDLKTFKSVKDQKEGKVFSVDLVDEDGGEIRATLFNDVVDQFHNILNENEVYVISKGTIKMANKRFSSLRNEYEITLDNDSTIVPVKVDPDNALSKQPKHKYFFTPIVSLTQHIKDDIVDIIGKVEKTGPLSQSKTKYGDVDKRTITVFDTTSTSVEVTLWSGLAQKLPWKESETPIVAFRGLRVSEFGTRSLTSVTSSQIEVNPDLPDTAKLAEWINQQHQQNTFKIQPITQHKAFGDSEGFTKIPTEEKDMYIHNRKIISQIEKEQLGVQVTRADYFSIRVHTNMIRSGSNMWYNACVNCKKKVVPSTSNEFYCENCKKTTHYVETYVYSFSATDFCGTMWFSAFNDVGEKLLGNIKASEMAKHWETKEAATKSVNFENQTKQAQEKKKETSPSISIPTNIFDSIVKNAQFKHWVFYIRAKAETYNNQSKVRCSVLSAMPVDFVTESALLLEAINKYK